MKPLAYITATGITQFGELFDHSLNDLILESANKALRKSELKSFKDLDLVVISSMTANDLHAQDHLSSLVTQILRTDCPVISVDAACAGGGSAIGVAATYLNSSIHKVNHALVIGAEKLTDHNSEEVATSMMRAASAEEEAIHGLTFPALGALVASRYFYEYPHVPKETLAKIAIKNHRQGLLNPQSHIKKNLNLKTYQQSPYVAEPLRLFDCAPISDGAAAVILSKEPTKNSTSILAFSQTQDYISLHQRQTLTSMAATKQGIINILKQARVTLDDINILEIHDAFTILELISLEDLGFYKPGKGYQAYSSPQTDKEGQMSKVKGQLLHINPSGGLKSCGHPVAATGIRQVIEIHEQLLGKAGKRQVKTKKGLPKLGLTQNLGGVAGTCTMCLIGPQK